MGVLDQATQTRLPSLRTFWFTLYWFGSGSSSILVNHSFKLRPVASSLGTIVSVTHFPKPAKVQTPSAPATMQHLIATEAPVRATVTDVDAGGTPYRYQSQCRPAVEQRQPFVARASPRLQTGRSDHPWVWQVP